MALINPVVGLLFCGEALDLCLHSSKDLHTYMGVPQTPWLANAYQFYNENIFIFCLAAVYSSDASSSFGAVWSNLRSMMQMASTS
jgi:hypothetical protein